MTNDALIQSLLPEKPPIKQYYDDLENGYNSGKRTMYDLCHASLSKAFADGVIARMPSIEKEEILTVLKSVAPNNA